MLKKAFTLIELIVVISILGILATIIIPNIQNVQNNSKETAIIADARNLQTAVDMYQLENNGSYPTTSEQPTIGDPKKIDFEKLYLKDLRKIPEHKGIYYWVDYQGKVWLSKFDSPTNLNQEDTKLTWTLDPNSEKYLIYEISTNKTTSVINNQSMKLIDTVIKKGESIPTGYDKDKLYAISTVYSNDFISPPVKIGYKGISPQFPSNNDLGQNNNSNTINPKDLNPTLNISKNSILSYSQPSVSNAKWQIDGGLVTTTLQSGIFTGDNHVLKINMPIEDFGMGIGSDDASVEIKLTKINDNYDITVVESNISNFMGDIMTYEWSINGQKIPTPPNGVLSKSLNNISVKGGYFSSSMGEDLCSEEIRFNLDLKQKIEFNALPPTSVTSSNYEWQVDGGNITNTAPNGIFESGQHTIKVRLTDNNGNKSEWVSKNFIIE